jgi:hypothetical protein
VARFVKHIGCPKCGSRDNLGIWDDGSKWCFGCKYFVRGETTVAAVERLRKVNAVDSPGIKLPEDITETLPEVARKWLSKYDLSWPVLRNHEIVWSPSRQLLIFPVSEFKPVSKDRRLSYHISEFKEDGLLMWQGRYFGEDPKHPKYISEGKTHEIIHLLGDLDNDHIFVVEDMVSAIKLSFLETVMPLFGCELGAKRANYLSRRFTTLTFWLDPDKRQSAMKQAFANKHLFKEVSVIYSDKDPKDYHFGEMRDIIVDHAI